MQLAPKCVLKHSGNPISDLQLCTKQDDEIVHTLMLTSYQKTSEVHIWDLTTNRVIQTYDTHESCGTVSVHALKDCMIICSKEGKITIISLQTCKILSTFNLGCVGFCKLSLLKIDDELLLLSPGGNKGLANIYTVKNHQLLSHRNLKICDDYNLGLMMCCRLVKLDTDVVAFCGFENGSIISWKIEQDKILAHLVIFQNEPVMCLDFDHVCGKGLAGGPSKKISKFSFNCGILKNTKTCIISNPGVSAIKIRNDRKLVAVAAWDHSVKIFSWLKLRPLAVLHYHSSAVQNVDFIYDETCKKYTIASASNDGKIAMWDVFN